MKKIMIIGILAVCVSTQCFALGESWVNQNVTAIGYVNLCSSPPSGFLCWEGKKIDVVQKNEKVKVLEHGKYKCALFFSYDFLKIERLEVEIPESKRYGYVMVFDDITGRALFAVEGQKADRRP